MTDTQEGMTAQKAFQVLLRDHVGPALRREGYKGPAGRYRKEVADYVVTIGFQKSKWSDHKHVDYRLNLRVVNPLTAERFDAANRAARALDREWQDAPAGNWIASFPGAMLPLLGRFLTPETFFATRLFDPRDDWITLQATAPLPEHAESLLDDIARCVFPEIDAQIRAETGDPDSPEHRPLNSDDVRVRARTAEYESTLARLRAVGIPTEPKETGIQINRK